MRTFFLLAAASLLAVVDVNAQLEGAKPYKELSQLPNLLQIVPAPPSFESAEFANDVVRYGWGKQQRLDPERLDMAVADAEWFDHTKVYLRYIKVKSSGYWLVYAEKLYFCSQVIKLYIEYEKCKNLAAYAAACIRNIVVGIVRK
jgi:hypothetical protein